MNSGASASGSSSESLNGSAGSAGEVALKKGPWTAAEDKVLVEYVERYGEGNWNAVRKKMGLLRCGKSCRLRWTNHLRPNLKKGSFTPDEERLILELHSQLGNKWARMAAQLPGRTDNEIKNFWNTRIKRRLRDRHTLYPHVQKPRQTPPTQPPPLPEQHSQALQNQFLLPQYQTAIPLFHNPFQTGFHCSTPVFDQIPSTTLQYQTSPLTIPPPRHKRYHDPTAFSISIASAPASEYPTMMSPQGIIPNAPLSFNLSSLQMEMGAMPSPGSFSMANPELPSSQLQFSRIMKTAESSSNTDPRMGFGGLLYPDRMLLGDMMEEAHTWANMNLPQNKCSNTYTKSETNRPASDLVSPSGMKYDQGTSPGINSSQEDIAKPADCHVSTSDTNYGRSLNVSSVGCASGAQGDNNDNLGPDMHDIAALFLGTPTAELGVLSWETPPEIC
ncbi:hypothetical protein MLD38_034232 [Melastoma candidum]|uniref:Uncharacterized protein n=1 Tax=Melastoma candidum TaxID=119954 RepID=A0ACB9M9A0_9MYRT|nr:hypothetical protein MLD38_034232 [Melastoma candidum]